MPLRVQRPSALAAAVIAVAFAALPAAALGQAAEIEVVPAAPVSQSPSEVTQEAPIPAGKKKPSGNDGGGEAAAPAVAAAPAPSGGLDERVGKLPFTGIDLLTLAGVALVMTGLGLGLRQVVRSPSRA